VRSETNSRRSAATRAAPNILAPFANLQPVGPPIELDSPWAVSKSEAGYFPGSGAMWQFASDVFST